jgi:hypothetical protein
MMATAALTKGTLRAVPFRLDGRLVPEALSRRSSRRSTAGIRRSTFCRRAGTPTCLSSTERRGTTHRMTDAPPANGEDRIRCGLFTNSSKP